MKTSTRIKSAITLLVGLFMGSAASLVVDYYLRVAPARRDVADQYVEDIQRTTRACELILEGKTNAARRMLEDDLLITAAGIKYVFPEQPGAKYHLWRIAEYFHKNLITPTGKYSNNLEGISLDYPTNRPAGFYYSQIYPSYLDSLMKGRSPKTNESDSDNKE